MAKTKQTVKFSDAQEMHKKNPSTFEAPDWDELNALKKEDIVKVCANDKERFWARIITVNTLKITAVVDNDLVYANELGFDDGDTIQFEKRHIYSIFKG